jgi:hypothetical protein
MNLFLSEKSMMRVSMLLSGGTGVTPVKSGVTPNFVGGDGVLVHWQWRRNRSPANGFGRDARNNRPEACSTPK